MNLKYSISIVVAVVLCSTSVFAPLTKKDKILMQLITYYTSTEHYDPIDFDDTYSQRVFKEYISRIDPEKQLFLKEDLFKLASHEFAVDDQLRSFTFDFFEQAHDLFLVRLSEVASFYSDLLQVPFTFSADEARLVKGEDRAFCSSQDELKERWRKQLKSRTLRTYLTELEEKVGTENVATAPFDIEIEVKARKKVEKNIARYLERLTTYGYEDQRKIYFDTLVNIQDPHSNYFPAETKENFDINMTGTLEGIGALLREEDGVIKVVRIIPGSASWRQKKLEAEDLILKVAQGAEDAVDVVNMRVGEAVKLIRGKKGTEVRLTVEKPDGRHVVIPIIRDIVVIEETYVRSAIITNEKLNRRFGYVYLPSFYRDFKNRDGRNATDDVRKALRQMTRKSIQGIVLDLRDNGGGALQDAVDISGLFIEKGPIVQVKNSRNKREILADYDTEILYKGPLVILMNQFSASASEILAAALQDYGRAVILGSESSFGKGTVQTFIPFDRAFQRNEFKPFGDMKVTIKKFYRISGGSTQYKGVESDIVLPDLYRYIPTGEKKLDFSLPWDTVSKLPYDVFSGSKDIETIKQNSAQRISNHKGFQLIETYAMDAAERNQRLTQSLNLNTIKKEQEKIRKEAKRLEEFQVPLSYLSIQVPQTLKDKQSEEKEKDVAEFKERISKDIYIDEAMYVLDDLI